MTSGDAPLILTALLAPEAADELDALRQRYFPPGRNFISAHVTMFHKLPGVRLRSILEDLRAACASRGPLELGAPGLRFLGAGVAIEIRSDALCALRAELARSWAPHLSAQDAQGYRPHVTIQNKVPPQEARRLHDELGARWQPRTYTAEGLQLWHYEGGPWRAAATVQFAAA